MFLCVGCVFGDNCLFREPATAAVKDVQKLQELIDYEYQHIGNFRRVYPAMNVGHCYEKFMGTRGSVCQDTIANKARTECSRLVLGFIP